MCSRQTLKLGYLDTIYVVSGEAESLLCHWYDQIIMNLLSEQSFLKLCQKENLHQSSRNIEIFVNKDKLFIVWRTKVMNFLKVMELCQTSRDQVIIKVGQNNFSETLSEYLYP